MLPLPESIAGRLLGGESLAHVIDEVSGGTDVRSNEGTFGVLTRNRLSRSAIFTTALLCAFAPFDRPEFYAEGGTAGDARASAPPRRVTGLGGVFFKADDPESLWAWYERHLGPGPAAFMLNYRVADLDAVLAALAAEGVAIDPKREDSKYGRFAWIFDPEGNRIELWQPPP